MIDLKADPIVTVARLEKRYHNRTVLRGLQFAINRGEILGLLGPNGAGKTTTLECIVGLRKPSAGRIRVLGVDPAADRETITRNVAVQPQSARLFPTLTVIETLRLFSSFYPDPINVESVIDMLDLGDTRKTRVKHLSGGQERRLLLGITLIGRPQLVVLDEPSAGLDPVGRQQLWNIIRELTRTGTTVVLSTHDMAEAAELCDRVAILTGGTITATGTPEELAKRSRDRTEVTFTVGTDVTDDAISSALELDFIRTDTAGGRRRVSVTTSDPDAVIRRLTFTLAIQAKDFHVTTGTLEDFYLDTVSKPQPSISPK